MPCWTAVWRLVLAQSTALLTLAQPYASLGLPHVDSVDLGAGLAGHMYMGFPEQHMTGTEAQSHHTALQIRYFLYVCIWVKKKYS